MLGAGSSFGSQRTRVHARSVVGVALSPELEYPLVCERGVETGVEVKSISRARP